MIVVVMGVAGSGKSTIGRAAAERLGWAFADADDHHPPANIAKMARGEPLDDADRWPWLDRLRSIVETASAERRPLILACSALKRAYRERLMAPGAELRFVFLQGDPALIRQRLRARSGHFASADLLDSQLAALEPPEDALALDVSAPSEHLVERVVAFCTQQAATRA